VLLKKKNWWIFHWKMGKKHVLKMVWIGILEPIVLSVTGGVEISHFFLFWNPPLHPPICLYLAFEVTDAMWSLIAQTYKPTMFCIYIFIHSFFLLYTLLQSISMNWAGERKLVKSSKWIVREASEKGSSTKLRRVPHPKVEK